MILKASERGGSVALAAHLLNGQDNDHVLVHDMRGFAAHDLFAAFKEVQAVSLGTRCKKIFFSLSLNPPEGEIVSVEDFENAIDRIESEMGLAGYPRAIVFHEKSGRRHAHVVWSRIDGNLMRAINLPHYKRRLNELSRQLYLEHEWKLPEGFENKQNRNPFNYSHDEYQQSKRARHDTKDLKKFFVEAWQGADSKTAFTAALRDNGFVLARGDRRGFVAVDAHGEIYSLSRWCGVRAKTLRAKLGNLDDLPSVDDALKQFEKQPENPTRNSKLVLLEGERNALVMTHRQERKDLKQFHETRQIIENKARVARLPSGLKGLWVKVSGQFKNIQTRNKTETVQCLARDKDEWQKLIDRQLKARQALQRRIIRVRQQHSDLKYDPAQNLILPRDDETAAVKIRRNPIHVLDVLIDKNETFTRNDIVRTLYKYLENPLLITHTVDQVMRSNELICVEDSTTPLYSTRNFQAEKHHLSKSVQQLLATKTYHVDDEIIDTALKRQNDTLQKSVGACLSTEQKKAIRHCLKPEQLSAVIGLAGSGKSTILSAVRDAWERQGYSVHGAALSGKAADGLQNTSGIQSRTLAAWKTSWDNGYRQLGKNDILVIDEAGMIGTHQMNYFLKAVKETGAKIVLVGDPNQLQPINAGRPFKELCETIGVAKLTEIHRQKKPWKKRASRDLANGDIAKALNTYKQKNSVVETKTHNAALAALVEDYMIDWELSNPKKTRLVLAHSRKDVHALNQIIRISIKTSGALKDETLIKTTHGSRAFASGDAILFTKNDHFLQVKNGTIGTVKSVTNNKIIVQASEGKTITFNPKTYSAIDHAYATTIHKSQGATIDHAFVLASKTMDKHLTYVAMTRHRENAKVYGETKSLRKMEGPGKQNRLPIQRQNNKYHKHWHYR